MPITGGGGSIAIGDTISGGTANRVLYLDGSGLLATGANLTFDGTVLRTNTLRLPNTSAIQWEDSGGTAWDVLKVDGSNVFTFRAPNSGDIQYLDSGNNAISVFMNNGKIVFNNQSSSTGDFQVKGDTNANTLYVDVSGDGVGFRSATATHAITFAHEATYGNTNGIAFYETTDQTTNYSRMHVYTDADGFKMISEVGGSGTHKTIYLNSNGTGFNIDPNNGRVNWASGAASTTTFDWLFESDKQIQWFPDMRTNPNGLDAALSIGNFGGMSWTSGTTAHTRFTGQYVPTSGSGVFNGLSITYTINQTGGASGITRGLYLNPTITAAADFRILETTYGNAIINTGAAGVKGLIIKTAASPSANAFETQNSSGTAQTVIDENFWVGIKNSNPGTTLDVAGSIRSTTSQAPSSGVGLELLYSGGGVVQAYNRDTSAYTSLTLAGSTISLAGACTFTQGITVDVTSTIGGIRLTKSDGSNTIWESDSNQDLAITTNGGNLYLGAAISAKHLSIANASGRVGIGVGTGTIGAQLHIDQSSTTAAVPVLTVDQADVSEEFIRFIGTSANGVLTQSIVEETDVATATRAGFLKIYVSDDGNQLTDQAYFVPIYTLA